MFFTNVNHTALCEDIGLDSVGCFQTFTSVMDANPKLKRNLASKPFLHFAAEAQQQIVFEAIVAPGSLTAYWQALGEFAPTVVMHDLATMGIAAPYCWKHNLPHFLAEIDNHHPSAGHPPPGNQTITVRTVIAVAQHTCLSPPG